MQAILIAAIGCPSDDYCESDSDCPETHFCNSALVCQRAAGCRSNADCREAGTFCEAGSGRCLAGPPLELGSPCSAAGQCPYGSICIDLQCAPGCFDHGDCLLGELCIDGGCQSEDRACVSTDFCGYGEVCEAGACRPDSRGRYCEPCPQASEQDPSPCGPSGSLCIVNSYGPGPDAFCGVACANGEACPNGYVCTGVATLTTRECASDAECDADRTCLIGEGRTSGFCSCATDEDCPSDVCDSELHVCRWSGAECGPDLPCAPIGCESGACIIGHNCAPIEGLYCDVLTSR
jgi:hypothetical protein